MSMLGKLVEVVDDLCDREHQGFLEAPLEAHPLLGKSNQSSMHSTMMRASSSSHRSASVGRGL